MVHFSRLGGSVPPHCMPMCSLSHMCNAPTLLDTLGQKDIHFDHYHGDEKTEKNHGYKGTTKLQGTYKELQVYFMVLQVNSKNFKVLLIIQG